MGAAPSTTRNSLRIPINTTLGASIHTGQWYCIDPQDSPVVLQMCGKAWADANGKEYAALAIQAPPAGFDNPISNPNITIFKANEKRTTLPIQLNNTAPYVISQMVNTGNIFDSKAAKTGTTKSSHGIVLMDKANPVGIFYSETCRDDIPGGIGDTNILQSASFSPTVSTYPTPTPPTYFPTTTDYEPDICGQLMYADYIAYYFDGHGRVTIGVTGTVGETAFF